MTRRGTVPPGWKDNPTAWAKRIRLVVLASVGLCFASYLALYQLGVLTEVWDPFFPEGSPKVLHLLEPVVVGAWCTPCLLSAFISFTILWWGVDEVLATPQYLRGVRSKGGSPWEALWGTVDLRD